MTEFDSYKDEEQETDHTWTWVAIIVMFVVLAFGLIWLSFKVSRQMSEIRANFWSRMKILGIGILILTIIFGLVLIVLNSIGKKKKYDKHFTPDEETTEQ